MATVQNETHVIIKRARETRLTFVKKGTTGSAGKIKFEFNDLIGRQFGVPYEVKQKRLYPCLTADFQKADVEEDQGEDQAEKDVEENDDDLKMDGGEEDEQSISHHDVEKMRKDGASGHEIITKLAMGNASFRHKTAYAKEKYLSKKAKKYSAIITVYPPSVRFIHEIYYNKDADKIAYLRQDYLAHLLTWGNVHHGCRVAVVENCLGIVTAAVLERMGGGGRCVRLHKGTQLQSIPCLAAMDFSETTLAPLLPFALDDFMNLDRNGEQPAKASDQMELDDKRKVDTEDPLRAARREQREAQKTAALEILREGRLDSFIMAVKEHPLDLMKRLLQCTLPSRPFVVYCTYVQPLLECYQWLREDGKTVNVRLLDNFYRKHQVLPGRSHPEMNQPVAGGYILTGVTVSE